MAKQIMKGLSMLMLLAVLSLATAVASANGQSSRRVVASIPFNFTVGSMEMPAGTYAVEATNSGSDAMKIVGTSNEKSVIRLSSTLHRFNDVKGKLVFHRYENQYFLAEIWPTGERAGRQLLKSSGERAIQRELASNQNRYERVEIALAIR